MTAKASSSAPSRAASKKVPGARRSVKTKAKATAAKPPARIAVVVLGMHRSGTSALAGVLGRLGCDLPRHEMPATASNARGFYESSEIYLLNNALMDSAGIDWRNWHPFPEAWQRSPRAAEFEARISQVLAEEFGSSSFFVMKDPRMCRLFVFWQRALKQAGCTPAIVHTHRNPLEVAQSLLLRKKIPVPTGLMIWLRYMLDSESATRGQRRTFTSFPDLLQNWQGVSTKIETDLGLTFPRRSLKTAREIDMFLTRDMKNFDSAPAELTENPQVASWVKQTYEIFERWVAGGEEISDHKMLDAINQAFSTSASAYGPLIVDLEMTAEASARKQAEKLEKTARDAQSLRDKLETLTDELAATRSALLQRQHESEQAHDEITSLNAQIADLEEKYDAALAAPNSSQAEAIEALEQKLVERQQAVSHLQRENKKLSQQIQTRYQELAQLVQLVQSLETQSAEAQKISRAEIAALSKTADKRKRELLSALQEAARLTEERDYLHHALHSTRNSTSWKFTAPLRWVLGGLKGRK